MYDAMKRWLKWFEQHDKEMSWTLAIAGVILIIIALLPHKYAGFKAIMIGHSVLPLPY